MIKVTDMAANAKRLTDRAKTTKLGVWCFVGYSGTAIIAGEKIRKSMPHEKVQIDPTDTPEEAEVKLAMAVARLIKPITESLETWVNPGVPRNRHNHQWSREKVAASKRGKGGGNA